MLASALVNCGQLAAWWPEKVVLSEYEGAWRVRPRRRAT